MFVYEVYIEVFSGVNFLQWTRPCWIAAGRKKKIERSSGLPCLNPDKQNSFWLQKFLEKKKLYLEAWEETELGFGFKMKAEE